MVVTSSKGRIGSLAEPLGLRQLLPGTGTEISPLGQLVADLTTPPSNLPSAHASAADQRTEWLMTQDPASDAQFPSRVGVNDLRQTGPTSTVGQL